MSLEELSAREEIRQAIYLHFRAGDRLDAEMDRQACWDDAIYIGGPLDLPMGEAIPLIYDQMLGTYFKVTNHYMMNLSITVDGHVAAAEVYAIAYHVLPTDRDALAAVLGSRPDLLTKAAEQPHELWLGIRYSMKLEQRGGVWKIAAQKLVIDWSKLTPYTGIDGGGVYDFLTLRGTRDRSDPSYEWLNP